MIYCTYLLILYFLGGVYMITKQNRGTIIALIFVFVGIYITELHVHYYGDDYYYAAFLNSNFWGNHINHYLHNNGRFIIHFLVTLFLKADIHVWYAVNAGMIAASAYFIFKITRSRAAAFLLLTIHFVMARESIYWITGSFNYVYPAMMLLIYWYLLICRKKTLSAVMAFFAAATIEHMAVAVNVLTVCYILYGRITEGKFDKAYMVNLMCAVIGAATVFFAPGTTSRAAEEGVGEFGEEFILSVKFVFRNTFVGDYTIKFAAITLIVSGIYLWKHKLKLLALCSLPIPVFMYCANNITKMPFFTLFQYRFMMTSTVIFCSAVYIITAIIYYKETKSVIPAVAFIVTLVTCVFIIFSPTLGPRVLLLEAIMYMVFFSCIVKEAIKQKEVYAVVNIVLLVMAIHNTYITYTGYSSNDAVYADNEALIELYHENGGDTLLQRKLIDEEFGWSMPYNSTYHEKYYKLYYHIPEETQIIWE